MAGDWIKMRSNLWDDPRVSRICDLTDIGEATVVGGLYLLWAAADQHSEDGCMPGLTLRAIDRKTGINGFAAALLEIGWIADDPQGVVLLRFEEHNGASAKRRCMEAQRKANVRNLSASDADTTQTESAENRTACGAREREEKEKEKKESKTKNSATAAPIAELIGLGVDERVAKDWIAHRKAKRASSARTVIEDRIQQAALAGISLEDAMRTEVSRGWQGFNAEWLKPNQMRAPPTYQDKTDKRRAWAAELTGENKREQLDFIDV